MAKAIMDKARASHYASGTTATPGASSGQPGATANDDAAMGASSGQLGATATPGASTGQLGASGPRPRRQNLLSPAEWADCPWRFGQAGPYDWEY